MDRPRRGDADADVLGCLTQACGPSGPRALSLKPGDNIDIHVLGDRSFAIEKAPGARALLARIRKYRGRLPSDFKFDRVGANERR